MRETVPIMTRLARQRWTILTITLLAAAGTALFTLRTSPVYEARALLLVDRGEKDAQLFGEPAPNGTSTRLTNELETLRSRAVAEIAARRLLERKYADSAGRQPLRILAGKEPGELAPAAEVVRRLEESVDIRSIRESDIIRVIAHGAGRLEAPLIVSAYLDAFSERKRDMSLERIGAARELLHAELKNGRQTLDAADSALQALTRESDVALEKRYQQAAATERSEFADVAVLDPPVAPDKPVSPDPLATILAGLAAGLVAGTAAALLRIATDARIYSPRDILRHGYVLAAAIRRVRWIRKNSEKRSGILDDGRWYDTSLIPLFHPFDPAARSFRDLLTALTRGVENRKPLRVMVTSADPGEGRTMVVANLAVTAARHNKRVLLVDADLRRPTLHQLFNILPAPGLSDYIRGTNRFDEAVRISVLENLDVICCGTAVQNGGRLLTSWRVKDFLEKLAPAYELFLFDAPPLLTAPDTASLSASMDTTLAVVRAGRTRMDRLRLVVEKLRAAGSPATVVVLNNYDAGVESGASGLANYSLSS